MSVPYNNSGGLYGHGGAEWICSHTHLGSAKHKKEPEAGQGEVQPVLLHKKGLSNQENHEVTSIFFAHLENGILKETKQYIMFIMIYKTL